MGSLQNGRTHLMVCRARMSPPHDRGHGQLGAVHENPGERGLPVPGLSHFPVHHQERNAGVSVNICPYGTGGDRFPEGLR